jgi:hypothetical protein
MTKSSSEAAQKGDGDPAGLLPVAPQGDAEACHISAGDMLEELGFRHEFNLVECLDWKALKKRYEGALRKVSRGSRLRGHMKKFRLKIVMMCARLFRVPIDVHQRFFMSS